MLNFLKLLVVHPVEKYLLSLKKEYKSKSLLVKRNSVDPSKSIPLWSKLKTNWRDYIYTPYLLRVDQEKFSMALYEIEQTQLDWDRMKMNGQLILDHLDVNFFREDFIIEILLLFFKGSSSSFRI